MIKLEPQGSSCLLLLMPGMDMKISVVFGFINILNILLGVIFSHIWFLGSLLNGLVGVGSFILWIVLMVKAYQGEMYQLPIAGDIANGIAGKI